MKFQKSLLITGTLMASVILLTACSSKSDGNYYSVQKIDGYSKVGGDKVFYVKGGKIIYNDGTKVDLNKAKVKEDTITVNGSEFLKGGSKTYDKAMDSQKQREKELTEEKKAFGTIYNELVKGPKKASEEVTTNFMSLLKGTYTLKDNKDYSVSATFNGNEFSYNYSGTPDTNLNNFRTTINMSGELSTDSDNSVTTFDTSDKLQAVENLNIESNIKNKLKLGDLTEQLNTISDKLEEGQIAFDKKTQKKYQEIADSIKSINTWEAYKKLTNQTKIALYYNASGSTKDESDDDSPVETEISTSNTIIVLQTDNGKDLKILYNFYNNSSSNTVSSFTKN